MIALVEITCPHCEHSFPVMPVESTGFCKCGMDYELHPEQDVIVWKPDPEYTPDADPVTVPLRLGFPLPVRPCPPREPGSQR